MSATSSTAAVPLPCLTRRREVTGKRRPAVAYTAIIRTVPRRGDNAEMAIIGAGLRRPARRMPSAPTRSSSIFCGWQRQNRPVHVSSATPSWPLARLDPLRPMALRAAGRTDSGCIDGQASVVISTAAADPRPRVWPKGALQLVPACAHGFGSAAARRVPSSGMLLLGHLSGRFTAYTLYNGRTPQSFWRPTAGTAYRFASTSGRWPKRWMVCWATRLLHVSPKPAAAAAIPQPRSRRWLWSGRGDSDRLRDPGKRASSTAWCALLMGQLVWSAKASCAKPSSSRRCASEARRGGSRKTAPAPGLCLLRVGYPEELFAPALLVRWQPHFRPSRASDPPPLPPGWLMGGSQVSKPQELVNCAGPEARSAIPLPFLPCPAPSP